MDDTPSLYLGAVDVSGAGVATNRTGIIASAVRTGLGTYRVTLSSPVATTDIFVLAVLGTTPGGAVVEIQGALEYDVLTSTPAGAAADLDFFFGVKPFGAAASNVSPVEVTQALAVVSGFGGGLILVNSGFAAFGAGSTKNGTGDYTLRLLRPTSPGNRTLAPVLYVGGGTRNRRIVVEPVSATDLRVRISNAVPAAVDEEFQLAVGRKTAGSP